jgi:hypothetical protein
MRTFKIFFIAALLILLVTACAPSVAAPSAIPATAPQVRIESPAAPAQVNDTVSVSVKAENISNLTAFEAHLSFDAKTLEVVSILDGDFVKADFSVQNTFDNAAGTIDYAIAQINQPPANGSGILFTINFRAKSVGDSPIQFRETTAAPAGLLLSDSNGTAIQVSLIKGNISVK